MSKVTVFSKPHCVQCNATKRALDKASVAHVVIDVSESVAAFDYLSDKGHSQMPVVEVFDNDGELVDSWTGFDPEKIKALA